MAKSIKGRRSGKKKSIIDDENKDITDKLELEEIKEQEQFFNSELGGIVDEEDDEESILR